MRAVSRPIKLEPKTIDPLGLRGCGEDGAGIAEAAQVQSRQISRGGNIQVHGIRTGRQQQRAEVQVTAATWRVTVLSCVSICVTRVSSRSSIFWS